MKINSDIARRAVELCNYIIETKKTIREVAKVYKISKSTVHKDIGERMKNIDIILYNKVKIILDEHIKMRHINGGMSTKKIYEYRRKLLTESLPPRT